MTDELVVLMGAHRAGRLLRAANGALTLEYDDAYRHAPEATRVSVSIPLQQARHRDPVVSNWLWGLLPDNDDVVRRWARHFETSARSAFDLLATPIGLDCAGAVRFVAPADEARAVGRGGRVRWIEEEEVGERIAALRRDAAAWLGTDFTGRFSLAGAQAKVALARVGERWGLPEGDAATTHILKPAIHGFDDHDLNEHLCLQAARRSGLPAVSSEVLNFAGEQAIVVERYDRLWMGDDLVRIHQEDLCQALGRHPSQKYQAEGGPTPAEICALLRRVMPMSAAEAAVVRFVDALLFNWVVGGTDAHAKNYSVLLAGRQVRLAPLYDIASALPYGTHERKLKLAMKLGGEYSLTGQRASTWERLAADAGLDVDEVVARGSALCEIVPDAFDRAIETLANPTASGLAERLAAAVRSRAERCARSLDP